MNRSFLTFMGYVSLSVLLIRPAIPADLQASSPSSPKPPNYKLKQKTKHTNTDALILVPPPPPAQPSLLDWPGLSGFPDFIGYLNADELKAKLDHLHKQIDDAKLQETSSEKDLTESKERANRFDSLFAEGVVSRKELESAKKDVNDKERSVDNAKGNVADLEIQEGAIVRQLNLHKRNSKSNHQSHKSQPPKPQSKKSQLSPTTQEHKNK